MFRTLEVGKVGLLVERGALQTERVDDVVDLLLGVLQGLIGLLGGRVGANVWGECQPPLGSWLPPTLWPRLWAGLVRTDLDAALGDHGAVGLVDDTVDLGEVVRVRDDLIAADNVLVEAGSC